jgi:hypothetical protein
MECRLSSQLDHVVYFNRFPFVDYRTSKLHAHFNLDLFLGADHMYANLASRETRLVDFVVRRMPFCRVDQN